jgi:hypothetical protein
MASELRVNTLKDAAGNNSVAMQYVAGGSARAWLNFNLDGTHTARDSLNLSSLTDNGVGDSTITLSNAMDNSLYTIHFSSFRSKNGGLLEGQTPSTSSYRIQVGESVDGNERDTSYNFLANFGDLA